MRPEASVAITLDSAVRELLDGKNFATLATINPDGSPQASVLWILRDGDVLLASVTSSKQKARNLARDPRVSVAVFDAANPYQSVEIRGTVELIEDPEKRLPMALSHKYLGVDPPGESADELRLIVRILPTKINRFGVTTR
jgi:PPOX class probable F420-dependent enzyme